MKGIGSTEHILSCRSVPDHSVWVRGSSGCERPLRRERDWWPCSNESTSHVGSPLVNHTADTVTESLDNMESNTSRLKNRNNPIRFVSVSHGLFRHACRQPGTIPAEQFHTEYVRSLVAGQTSGVRNGVVCGRCRSQHHGGNMPTDVSFLLLCVEGADAPHILSLLHTTPGQSRCLARVVDYFREFLASRIVPRRPSYGQSSLVTVAVP